MRNLKLFAKYACTIYYLGAFVWLPLQIDICRVHQLRKAFVGFNTINRFMAPPMLIHINLVHTLSAERFSQLHVVKVRCARSFLADRNSGAFLYEGHHLQVGALFI